MLKTWTKSFNGLAKDFLVKPDSTNPNKGQIFIVFIRQMIGFVKLRYIIYGT
jgi:hypothetical protein